MTPSTLFRLLYRYLTNTAGDDLEQIDRKGYADKYALDGRPVTKVGIAFSSKERNVIDWKAEGNEK